MGLTIPLDTLCTDDLTADILTGATSQPIT